MKTKLKLLTPLFLGGLFSGSVHASTISFENLFFSKDSNTISVDIRANFDKNTAGGDFIFDFDQSALTFGSYTSGGTPYDLFDKEDGNYNIAIVDTNDDLAKSNGIAAGDYLLGTLTFNVSKAGTYDFSGSSSNFYKSGFEEKQDISFNGSSISITADMISAVPEPSELALMLTGLGFLSFAAKTRKSKNFTEIGGK